MDVLETHLVERDRELGVLEAATLAACRGTGRLVVIEGPAGIGKTALMNRAGQAGADVGLVCARARASPAERYLAFGVVRQLFESFVTRGSPSAAGDLLSGAAHLARAAFLHGDGPKGPGHPSGRPFAALHGLYRLVHNLTADGPMLVCVDDVQWADGPSLQFLSYLARRLDDLPVAVVVTLRDGEKAADPDALGDLVSFAVALRPAPFSESATTATIESGLGRASSPAFTAECHRATGGNPFLLHALVTALAADEVVPDDSSVAGLASVRPASVVRAVSHRLTQLPDSAIELARAVAVLGDGTSIARAGRLAGLTGGGARAADVLVAAAVLVREEAMGGAAGLAFVHPLVRGAVEEAVPREIWADTHSAAAELLGEHGVEAGTIAIHLLHAEPRNDSDRVDILREAARTALGQGAPALAVTYLHRAQRENATGPTGSLLRELGTAQARAGVVEAAGTLVQAMAVADDPYDLAFAALECGRALVMAGRANDASAVCGEAAALLGRRPELAEMLEVEKLVHAHAIRSVRGRVLEHLDCNPPEVGSPRLPARLALALAAVEETMAGDSAAGAAGLARRALGEGELLALVGPEAPALWAATVALALSGQIIAARDESTCAMSAARQLGSAAGFATASAFRGWFSYQAGAFRDAEADSRSALETPMQQELWALVRPVAIATLVDTLCARGRSAEAQLIVAANPVPEHARMSINFDLVLMARGRARRAQRRTAEALHDFEEAGRRHAAWGATTSGVVSWRAAAAEALMDLGEREDAAVLAEEELRRARSLGAPRTVGIALRACAATTVSDADGVDLLRQAVAVLEPSEARFEHAGALVDLGSRLRRSGCRSEARLPLREGLELARRSGAEALAHRARMEIEATGARVGREAVTGVAALTPSERRVAVWAGEGLSNRDIARAAFIAVSTVELHLTSAYRKLGIRSRRQLESVLRHGDENGSPGA